MKIAELFDVMIENAASDLHITTGAPPMVRVNGDLVATTQPDLTVEDVVGLLSQVMDEEQREELNKAGDLDFGYDYGVAARFRVNAFVQRKGPGAAFRLIPSKIRKLDELGMPPAIARFADLPKGLVLVTGSTGSGKSTTLAALVDLINRRDKLHILTIEDPIEFVHENKSCLVNQREIHSHTESFATALRAGLREDPDVILLGELRDLETIELAITAAETGHLVFGTLHTSSAAKTVDRVINVFPTNQQEQIRTMLAESLQGVVCQNLLKAADGKGRIAACEILVGSAALANLIREGKTFQIHSIMQTGKKAGMQTMDQHLLELVQLRKITRQEALQHAVNREAFEKSTPLPVTLTGAPAEPRGERAPAAR
jgi:twitching motility protein PilT